MADPECSWCGYGEDIVDFILADRKRELNKVINMVRNQRDFHSGSSMTRKGTCDEIIDQLEAINERI